MVYITMDKDVFNLSVGCGYLICWQMCFCCFQAVWSVGETCPVDAPASIERDNEFIARVVYRLPEQENVDAGTIKRLLQAVKKAT